MGRKKTKMSEVVGYQDMPRATRQAIVRDLSQRVLDIVTSHHPEPVLGAEIEAQITEVSEIVDIANNEPLGDRVLLSSMSLALAKEQAVKKHGVVIGSRGNQLTYRLPDVALDPNLA